MRIHRHRQRKPKYNIPKYFINERIQAPEVRVVDPDDGDIGIVETKKAIAMAAAKEMDLVEVSPKAKPPVCKILDYGAFKYQKEKEAKKRKAQSAEVELKGVRLSVRIGEHDRAVRMGQTRKFFEKGHKVKLEMPLRGREKAHKDVAQRVMESFIEELKKEYELRIEQTVKFQAGRMTSIIARA